MREVVGTSSLTDQVVAAIRAAVLDGELVAGELYSAYGLAERLNVSRTPVREALLRLAEAGMVRFERNRGFRVLKRDPREVVEVFHLRLLLEVPAAGLAARHADAALVAALTDELDAMRAMAATGDDARFMHHDRRFHHHLLLAGGNARLAATVDGLRDTTTTLGTSTAGRSRTLDEIVAEHEPVLRAVIARDPEGAMRALRTHIAHTAELLLAQLTAETGVPLTPRQTELLD
ncbi:GntR family transcriptional regulator [Saccharothrix obliqua]|uniref:GntR family transcriptional regulator n=1 Tax=Saccharothrix obliqua TaxID=2861747 RepID=UPI001C5CF112|nr:GntR family transcriptional regulator [Saccharothrix obliqua]MBW4720472.1 GntR family transcriptional regulator [Saccharothrix obliqua]